MRIVKSIGVLVCTIAISAVAATAASATILPGKAGTKLEGASGKATLQIKGGASITCKESKLSGEVLGITEAEGTVTFSNNCTTGGLPISSRGDAKGVIKTKVKILTCTGSPGVLLLHLPLPLELEVPSTKLLLVVEGGAYVGVPSGEKNKTFFLTIAQAAGKQSIEVCNKQTAILQTSTDGGAFVQSGLEASNATLTFIGEEEEFM